MAIFIINPQLRSVLKYKILNVDNNINTFNVGKIDYYKNIINRKTEISIWGYLTKQNNKYFLVSSKSFSNVKYLYRPRESLILMDENNNNSLKIKETCLNRYVESKGYLVDLPKNQMSLLYSLKLKYIHTIDENDISCRLH